MAKIEYKSKKKYYLHSSDKKLNEFFRNEINTCSKKYVQVGYLADGNSFYKYYPFDTAIMCLENESMAFVEPSRWNDAYESLYYEANYSLVSKQYEDSPRVYATCATNIKNDEPAWRIYSKEDNICVQFEIDRPKFRFELLKAINDGDSIYEGVVQYQKKYIIDNISKKKRINKKGDEIDNENYNLFIYHDGKSFSIENYLNLLLLKRDDFFHEQETRFFIVRQLDLTDKAEKAKEQKSENSDATKRVIEIVRGDITILNNIKWINCLKGITINANEKTLPYKSLADTVNKMIDYNIKDVSLNKEYKAKLKPKSYLVYGTIPPTITIDGLK